MDSDNDDSSSSSVRYDQKDVPRPRKQIHPARYAHILQLRTRDEDSNVITVCSIQDFRKSGTFDSDEGGFPSNDSYLVSFPDDDSDIYSINDDNTSSMRNSIYSVKSGQDIYISVNDISNNSLRNSIYSVKSGQDVYSVIDATISETISDLNASLQELDKNMETKVDKRKPLKHFAVFDDIYSSSDNESDAVTLKSKDKIKKSVSSSKCDVLKSCEYLMTLSSNLNKERKRKQSANAEDNCGVDSRRFQYCFEDIPEHVDKPCAVVIVKTDRASCLQRALKYSGFKKLPEGVELTLGELRAMALRQQQQIDCQHQLLAAREQRLRFLKQQEARHHQVAAENERLRRLRERVEAQELKLRRLRALRGQLDQTNINNVALTSDLESIRLLFNEKEKELSVAVAKVEELTRQLEEVRRGRGGRAAPRAPPRPHPPAALELDKLRRELMYRNKLNEQQNARLSQQREALTARQAEMASIDQRISELQGRLQRKRVANRQLATQITQQHHNTRATNPATVQLSNYPNPGSGGNPLLKGQIPRGNVAAVEPYNHIPHPQNVTHNFQALKHNAVQNNLPMKIVSQTDALSNHITQQDGHYLQQKQFANQLFNNGSYPQRLQANLLQTETQFNPSYPVKQSEINAYQQGLTSQHGPNDQKILLEHINKYNIDLQKTVNHNQNVNNNNNIPTSTHNSQQTTTKQKTNDQEFLPEFTASKSDPKYQTLPYNTKFTANGTTKTNSNKQFYDDNSKIPNESSGIIKVSSSSNVNNLLTAVSGSNTNHMTAHSTPLTINKGLATPLMQNDGNTNNGFNQENSSTYHIQKSESWSKCSQEEKENQRQGEQQPKVVGEQYKVPQGGRAELVRGFSQQNTATSTGQIKPVSSVAPTSVQVSSGKPSPIYQTSSTKIQPVQPQTVANTSPNTQPSLPKSSSGQNSSIQSLLLSPPQSSSTPTSTPDASSDKSVPRPTLPPKPAPKLQTNAESTPSQPHHQQNTSAEYKNGESTLPPVPTSDPPSEQDPSNSQQTSSTSSTDSQQMIIKARPLTIRKQPLSEQPKLKSQSNNVTKNNGVNVATTRRIEMPAAFLFPEMEQQQDNSQTSSENNIQSKNVEKSNKSMGTDVTDRAVLSAESSETSSEELSEKNGVSNLTEQMNTVDLSNVNGDVVSRRVKKGNLKQSGKVNLSRRVSFDPLALLLDASLEGELELVKKTATQVANPSAANDEGITALHNAICAGHFEIVKFLVEFGCDVNAQDSDGWTPLHCAASCNNVAMVRFLVENGACIFATTLSDHETAAQKCEEDEEGFDGCSEYLYSVQEKLGIMNGGAVYAVFPYSAHEVDELSFIAGARLSVLRKGDDAEREWWWAHNATGQEGYVPRNLLGLYPRVTPKPEQ